MPTGYVEFFSILLTRREYSSIEKRYRQGVASLDHFEYAAVDRVIAKLIKKGWYEDCNYDQARGMFNNSLGEWFESIDKGYRIEKK